MLNTLKNYLKSLYPFILVYFVTQNLLRVILVYLESANLEIKKYEWLLMFIQGFISDLVTLLYVLIPIIIYYCLIDRLLNIRIRYMARLILLAIFSFIMLFNMAAEYLFWDEFQVRFNFIAVDYLVYTHEVISNIYQSYPVILIILILLLISCLIAYLFTKTNNFNAIKYKTNIYILLIYSLFCYIGIIINPNIINFNNEYANEISKNGIYSLFSAFKNNSLSYSKFYLSSYNEYLIPNLKELIYLGKNKNFINDNVDDITRVINPKKSYKNHNVILVVMESMSAEFMKRFGNNSNLTPNLDRLSNQGISFSSIYATGTRTVKGLEAITLSIPPSPGGSIIRRSNNENLYSLGSVFKDRGYDVKFLYGGYGYFDNMNYFFSNNNFSTIDRLNFANSEQTFSNAWGLCDEDLYNKAISEASKSYKNGKPFIQLVMSTSNHRPYTFPPNKIDIASDGSGKRFAGVKYADYAIGELIRKSSDEPWFKDTIFVFVADHTAGSAGKVELTVNKYHIPFIFYAPHILQPKTIDKLGSQIDVTPTLLGIMNFNYVSKFFGIDLLQDSSNLRAFISNNQKLGYLTPEALTILKPIKNFSQYTFGGQFIEKTDTNIPQLTQAIGYYYNAQLWQQNMKRINSIKPN